MDETFRKRYESFQKSLDDLNEAKKRDMSDSFVLSGTSAKFSITFDLSWKVMKDILVEHYSITDFVMCSPEDVFHRAFQAELITSDLWMEMLSVRNRLIHDYDSKVIEQYCDKIVNVYIDTLYEFRHVADLLFEYHDLT